MSNDYRVITPESDEWPTQLGDLADPPTALYVRGDANLAELATWGIAIVGARAATAYGEQVANDLGYELASHGVSVVSGLAYGIDGAAHRAALRGQVPQPTSRTVAVLGSGFNVEYPAGHAGLARRIVEAGGLLVSEYAPDVRPQRAHFLERNRLIAALSRGVVVVEAALRSGSLATARRAREINRHVWAVPGSVTSALSRGTHELVRTGEARLVAEFGQVFDDLARIREPERRGSRTDEAAFRAAVPRRLGELEVLEVSHFEPGGEHSYGHALAVTRRPDGSFATHRLIYNDEADGWVLEQGRYDLATRANAQADIAQRAETVAVYSRVR